MDNNEDNQGCLWLVATALLLTAFVLGAKLDDVRDRLARIEQAITGQKEKER